MRAIGQPHHAVKAGLLSEDGQILFLINDPCRVKLFSGNRQGNHPGEQPANMLAGPDQDFVVFRLGVGGQKRQQHGSNRLAALQFGAGQRGCGVPQGDDEARMHLRVG